MKQHKNGCEKTLKTFRLCAIPVIAQNAVQILRAPSSAIYFTSLIPDEYRSTLVYRLPVMMIHCEIWISIFATMMLIVAVLYLYVFPTEFTLREMTL